jgi:hypothetical protein
LKKSYYGKIEGEIERGVHVVKSNGEMEKKLSGGGRGEGSAREIKLSDGGKYFLIVKEGNGSSYDSVPSFVIMKSDGNEVVRVLEDNLILASNLDKLNLPSSSFLSIPSLDNSLSLNAKILFPPNFNKKSKYGYFYFILFYLFYLFYFILFYFILFLFYFIYFILFYFILFYFILFIFIIFFYFILFFKNSWIGECEK